MVLRTGAIRISRNLARRAVLAAVLALLLPGVALAGQVRKVDRRGVTPGAYTTLSSASAALQPGDTLFIVPGSGPYREILQISKQGTAAQPIVVEGNGETITGYDPFQFTWNSSAGRYEYVLPAPLPSSSTVAKPFQHNVAYQGQRLLVDALTGRFTTDFAALSSDGSTLILGNASPTSGWEIGARDHAVRLDGSGAGSVTGYQAPISFYHVYRNLRASGANNDGFNLHGAGTDLRFENIEGFDNYDEGFSAHDTIERTVIDGAAFWANDNGYANATSSTLGVSINNVRSYGNLGYGIYSRAGVNVVTNSQAWDNGMMNMSLGGTVTSHGNTTYDSRWSRRQWVSYQESQDYVFKKDVPYTYDAYWKGKAANSTHQAYDLTGEEPTVLPASSLPPFALSFPNWQDVYFTSAQLADPATSGATADPDSDGRNNSAEYLAGTRPLTADSPIVLVSVAVTDAIASEVTGDPAEFRVRRTGPTTGMLDVSLSYAGSAVSETDYQGLAAVAHFPAGAAEVVVPVTPIQNGSGNPGATLSVRVAPDPSYVVGAGWGTVTFDPPDVPMVSIVALDASAAETGGNTGRFRIRRSGPTTAALTVTFSIGGTATNGADDATLPTSVQIPAGAIYADLTVSPIADGISESTETVVLTLTKRSTYALGTALGTVSIANTPP